MKTMAYRNQSSSSSRQSSVSPQGRVRKERSEERKEKQKVEATLRSLVGTSEDVDQMEFLQQIMSYIRELQGQLECDQENPEPSTGLNSLFSSLSPSDTMEVDKENDRLKQVHHEPIKSV